MKTAPVAKKFTIKHLWRILESEQLYRMINILEEIGALSRKNMYKIACGPECEVKDACVIEFDDDTIIELSGKSWNQVVQLGLRACGYSSGHKIKSVTAKSCEFSR